VPGLILAAVTPDNTPGGYYFTFLFPMVLFIVVMTILYVLFSRPHRRVPGRPISATASGGRPDAPAARAAAVAGGLSVAVGGGASESAAEPAGAHRQASGAGPADSGSDETPGDSDPADVDAAVSGEDPGANE